LGSLGVRLTAIGDRLRVNAPKGKLPTDVRAQIAERKVEILAYLGEHSPAKRSIPPPIHPRATEAPAPLSFAQERLWFLEQLEPQSAVYNICRAVRIGGNLNVSAIEAALNEIIRRHQTLRTAFRLVDGQAVQIVQPSGHLAINTIDLRSLSEGDRDVEIKRLFKADAECPFDLHGGSLLRCKLLRVADAEHILILVTHHAASDAWSMGILTRELWTLYQAYCQGKSSPLDPLPVQYSDYAVWQRDWLQGEVLEAQLSYWKEQLKELPILNLPTDRSRKPRQSFSGARVKITLLAELTTAINEASYRHGVTPFMTLLAAFQVLLYRYSGQEDFALGCPIANRRRPEIEGLIGFFVNTLVLRANLSGNPSFAEVLSRVKEKWIGANANQDLPLERLVQEIQPERDQSRNPLFQIMFVLQNATQPFSGIPSLRIEPVEIAATRSPFDLSLFLRQREGRYIGFFEYNTDLFNRGRIKRMVGHFQTLLEAAVSNPYQPVATLPILTEAERQQILVEWNDTAADYLKDKCIHQLFEEQVARTPDAVAVKFEDRQITYRELNRRANQLAHYLIGLGIGPEKLVGICVERSIEMVVGLLGILKAGGAYVPLDPSYPEKRLRFMIDDANIAVLLTQESLLDRTQNSILSSRPLAFCFDRDWPLFAQQQDDNPGLPVKSDNLAYVIYTSGSTGKPKGVAIEHRNTVNLLYWAKSPYGPTDLAGVLASTSICFDLSIFELFVPLSWGGKIILVENALSLRGRRDRDITLVNTVPSVMTQLLALGHLPESVRTVNLAGEPLKTELVNQLYQEPGVERVYDLYGPSETTTYTTFTLRGPNGPETIGRPIANTQIYILDGALQPVAVEIEGELYIGGAGGARGYLNRPELTTEKFIRDLFRGEEGSRLYRTGDRARYLPDGSIEFLGRTDNQVKIRGHRIELGEIESALTQHPTVNQAVVIPFDEFPCGSDNPKSVLSRVEGSKTNTEQSQSIENPKSLPAYSHNPKSKIENPKSLVAYVVSHAKTAPTVSELRHFLQSKLPDYMIPSLFIFLDALPLTSNGKLDRNALPPPDGQRPALDQGFVEPRTEMEELVAQVWREVLKHEKIGIYDNFFDLGGHSLLAAHVTGRLQETFNKAVPIRVLFDAPTVATMAKELEIILRDGHSPELPPIVRMPHDRPLPLSLNQEQLWRVTQMMPGTHYFNMPYVYHLSGDVNVEALERALKEIIRRHEALRTAFQSIDGQPVQIIQPVPESFLSVIDLRSAYREDLIEQARSSIIEERTRGFDIAKSPPIRAKLLRLTDKENLLLITAHHIVADHWSMQVFRYELIKLYEAFSRGRSSPLPEPVIQFADYALWERRLLNDGLFDDQLLHWTKELAKASSTTGYHVRHDSSRLFSLFSRHSIEISQPVVERLRLFAIQKNSTVFHVLLTALIATLYVATGERNVRIGTLVANRGRPETENVIGHFLNTVILITQVSPHITLHQLLDQVRDIALHTHKHQGFPIEAFMRELESKQSIDRAALFPVLVNYRRDDSRTVDAAGLTFARWNTPRIYSVTERLPATYDFIFNFNESSTSLTCGVNVMDGTPASANMEHVKTSLSRFLEILPSDRIGSLLLEHLLEANSCRIAD
jgi:amino acid adenylation domain-containing protein